MKFSEVVAQTLAWLQREGRGSYRALRLEFDLNEEVLDALKEEFIEVKELAVDKDGKMLVWTGKGTEEESGNRGIGDQQDKSCQQSVTSPQPPAPNPEHPTPHCRAATVDGDVLRLGGLDGAVRTIGP